ncbi:MAG TPA: ABC transporter substrate-binding protein [Euzebyales bacterium]|nr:ABC transporter substrate-binding protein [Euzebyales bacterium]
MHKRRLLLALVLVLSLVLAACTSASETQDSSEGTEPADPQADAPTATVEDSGQYERSETLYTSGKQWGPPNNWNPLMPWQYAMGIMNLVYETLFVYDPIADEYTPWIAESGDWASDTEYELIVREGVTFTDGEPLTAEDVAFTFQLGEQYEAVWFSPLWDFLDSVEAVDDQTVRFTFTEALYQQWANYLYDIPIVPEHIWSAFDEEQVTAGANEEPVGSGPYLYETHSEDRQVYIRNDEWWGAEALGLDFAPRRIVDIVNSDNNTALGLVLQGQLDLSNNFLPGVATLIGEGGGYSLSTFYEEPPYMLSANTAWLVPNHNRPPLDDAQFRKALASAINVPEIVERVYGDIVAPANPTGLLPIWDDYVDQGVVDAHGFTYDADEARRILADAGYEDGDGDGMVETPDGEAIELSVIVPNGWSDWMEAARVIANSAQAAGINVQADFPDFNALVDARNAGEFDLLINNERQMSNTPWTYLRYVFREVQEPMTTDNFARYDSPEGRELLDQLDQTPVDDTAGMQQIISQMQEIQLQDTPVIPLWYNGLWAQYNDTVWSNWPADGTENQALPATWTGYWQLGSINTLAELELAPPPEEEG